LVQPGPAQQTVSDEFDNVIVLTDEFYSEVASHPVPKDLEAVKVLTASPGLLDLFMSQSCKDLMELAGSLERRT
jgi:hypothetical protein